MIYKIFIDDSGSKNYITPYSKTFKDNPPLFKAYEQFWRDNYFVLCGIRVPENEIGKINNAINKIKYKYFKTHKVEIKSVWLRNPQKRKRHYIDKFKVTEVTLTHFMNEIYDCLSLNKKELKIIAVVFDKRFYGDQKRNSSDGDPLVKTSQVMFERMQYLKNAYHIVVFDQMESHLKLDKGAHGKILRVLKNKEKFEAAYVKGKGFDKIIDIKFAKSCGENFLQIADICAYNIYRQFVEYGREWTGSNKDNTGIVKMNMYKYFNKIRCNFVYNPDKQNRQVRGIGLTCLPDICKFNWDLLSGCDLK